MAKSSKLIRLHAREVLDSRGWPTVEVEAYCGEGDSGGEVVGVAIVPSGASTGKAEAHELRDGDTPRYDGRGVRKAVANVNGPIAAALLGMDTTDQAAIDARLIDLDGTEQKSRLGANALLGVSLAVAHAAAIAADVPLWNHLHALWTDVLAAHNLVADPPRMPLPMTNMISGGLHAGGNLDFQDILIMPGGAADYATGLEWITRIYRRLGRILADAGYEGRLVGDEGGYGPRLASNAEALEFVVRAIEAAGLRPGEDVTLALDVAATHFIGDDGQYRLRSEGDRALSSDEMIELVARLVARFPVESIEDPLAEDDWPAWSRLTARLAPNPKLQIIGDDLIATNPARLRRAINERAANAVLIKVNQIGTLTETLETMALARAAGFRRVVSARSGETEDTTIADLAVATAADQIKIGSIVRSERLAKYNRLLRIGEELEAAP